MTGGIALSLSLLVLCPNRLNADRPGVAGFRIGSVCATHE